MPRKNRIKDPDIAGSDRIIPPADVQSTNQMHPAFCFRHIENMYSLKNCDKDTQALLSQKLEELGQLNWENIQKADKKGKGHEIIEQNSLKKRQKGQIPADRKYLSFRLGKGKNSVFIGYRQGKVFYVVWIDPHGKVYSHGS